MIPFSPPHIDQKTIDEVVAVLKSGWITTGPKTKQLEKEIAKYVGVTNVLCLNSATAGLEIMLRWFGVGEGDEVIVPAYTYCATANVVLHCGAKPVMVDVSEDFTISVNEIEKAITENTKAIVPVDIAGLPCQYNAINSLVNLSELRKKFTPRNEKQKMLGRILVLADAAHSIGANYNGKKSGSFTDVSVLSFHAVKNLTTAEGGAVCLNLPPPFSNEQVYKDLCVRTLHGQSKDALSKAEGNSWEYDVTEAGYKANMPDVLAAIGLSEIRRYESDILNRRKNIFELYTKAFLKYDWAQVPPGKIADSSGDRETSYHVYALRIRGIDEAKRNAIIKRIFEQGVSVNVHFKPLPLLSLYKDLGYRMSDYPVTYDNYSREISLPVYYDLTDEQVQSVITATVNAVESHL
jgi:dTDP-4-amino-4,6-dideoxygalactose transaminase